MDVGPIGWMSWIAAVFGCAIGSFLNVVIYRMPIILQNRWKAECAELNGNREVTTETFNLAVPRSRCGSCGHEIRWFENIPILSYLFLKGKCSACGSAIGVRHLFVEVAAGATAYYCANRWGITPAALAGCIFLWTLLALALIDWDTTLLPDDLTLPLLWFGLLAALIQIKPVGIVESTWGAIAGYLSLWTIYWVFKLATGKEGMGFGDFKLFSALGAWFGWQMLIPIILLASSVGAIIGIGMKLSSTLREGVYVPFGPFLAGAGFLVFISGPSTVLRMFVV